MKIGSYQISVEEIRGRYECAVKEIHDNGETFYQVDVTPPYSKGGMETPVPMKFEIEMHFDVEVGGLKIKDLNGSLPADLLEIEEKLCDQISGIHH
jgi:hypothetical protein